MGRALRLLVGLGLFVVGALLGLYGLLDILYRGEGGNTDTYVTFGGREVDAQLAGAVSLIAAVVAIAAALLVLRSRRRREARLPRRP